MKYENDLNIEKAIENKEEVTQILIEKFKYDGKINKECTGYWVLKDGTILDCKAHGNIDKFLIDKKFVLNNAAKFNVYDGSQFMDYVNAVRIRNEVPHFRYPAYLTLPKNKLTSTQLSIVNQWIMDVLLNIKTYLIIDFNAEYSRQYNRTQIFEAIDDITFYYRTKEM